MPETLTQEKIQETAKEFNDRIIKSIKEFQADFHCQQCGKCCQEGKGVALWEHEVKKYRRIEPHLLRYTFILNGWTCLKMPCVFYNARKEKCKIYKDRPISCSLYPLAVEVNGNIRVSQNCTAIKFRKEEICH